MVVAGPAVAWAGQKAALATAVISAAVLFSFAMDGLELTRLVPAASVGYALFALQALHR